MIWRIYIIECKVLVASNQHISLTAGQSFQVQTQETGDSREFQLCWASPLSSDTFEICGYEQIFPLIQSPVHTLV